MVGLGWLEWGSNLFLGVSYKVLTVKSFATGDQTGYVTVDDLCPAGKLNSYEQRTNHKYFSLS